MLGDTNSLRAGMFLEELDAFSADCSARHADIFNAERPLSVVTAAHDGLSILTNLSADYDLRLRGAVVSVGNSSIEVRTDLLRVLRGPDASMAGAPLGKGDEEEAEELLGCCYTVMVARERDGFGKAAVHQLAGIDPHVLFETPEGEAKAAKRRQNARRSLVANALSHTPPQPSEVPLLHQLWREEKQREEGKSSDGGGGEEAAVVVRVPMSASEQRAVDLMQPSHRNMNGYMFGGYLMRRALEVAWLSAYRFGKVRPTFAGLDEVIFKKPIELGSMVELVGRAVFSAEDEDEVRVVVEAHKLTMEDGTREPTNLFHFVFHGRNLHDASDGGTTKASESVARHVVQPSTYEEGMLYLEGRRRWLAARQRGDA